MNEAVILAAAEGANPLIPNIWEILVTLLGFAVLMFIVVKFVVPMFEKTYAERTEAIEGGLAKAEAAQAEASAALDEYKQQLIDARTEANRIREEARAEGARRPEGKGCCRIGTHHGTVPGDHRSRAPGSSCLAPRRGRIPGHRAGKQDRWRVPRRRRTLRTRGRPFPG